MNCIECQENVAANLEGVLDPGTAAEFQDHLAGCPACQAEQTNMAELHQRLVTRGETASHVALGPAIMARIRRQQAEAPSTATALSHWLRWALGCGAATAAIALAVMIISPRTTANAAEVMTRGVQAAIQLTSVHLQCRVRSAPAENFSHIDPKSDFTTVELWKEWEGQARWRIEKPGRVAVMDGQSTVHFLRPIKSAIKVPAVPATTLPAGQPLTEGSETLPERRAPFDTGWLHAIADIEHTLETELRRAQAKGWPMTVTSDVDAAGAAQAVVIIEAASGLPQGDYLHNKFFDTADTRRVYRFDDVTGRLQGVQVYLHDASGDVLILEVTGIAYNEAFDAPLFQLDLPADVTWQSDRPELPGDPARYAGLTAEQAARAFFEACARGDWTEASAFWPLPVSDRLKSSLGGLNVMNIGESFTSAAYPGCFVPYEIKFKNGSTKKHNLALKKHHLTGRWIVDGGL